MRFSVERFSTLAFTITMAFFSFHAFAREDQKPLCFLLAKNLRVNTVRVTDMWGMQKFWDAYTSTPSSPFTEYRREELSPQEAVDLDLRDVVTVFPFDALGSKELTASGKVYLEPNHLYAIL